MPCPRSMLLQQTNDGTTRPQAVSFTADAEHMHKLQRFFSSAFLPTMWHTEILSYSTEGAAHAPLPGQRDFWARSALKAEWEAVYGR